MLNLNIGGPQTVNNVIIGDPDPEQDPSWEKVFDAIRTVLKLLWILFKLVLVLSGIWPF